jgi:hypothetical protein
MTFTILEKKLLVIVQQWSASSGRGRQTRVNNRTGGIANDPSPAERGPSESRR